jgi:hypothetical protein
MHLFNATYHGHTTKEFIFSDCQNPPQAEEKLRKELPANAQITVTRINRQEASFFYRGAVRVPAESETQAWLKLAATLPDGATIEVNGHKSVLQASL